VITSLFSSRRRGRRGRRRGISASREHHQGHRKDTQGIENRPYASAYLEASNHKHVYIPIISRSPVKDKKK
jgi:hypothetical protein